MPPTIEAEISRVLQAHLQAGIDPAPEKIDEYMQYISDDFTGIGTGPDELMRSRETLHAMIVKEREQMQYAVRFEVLAMFMRVLRPGLVLAEGEFQIEIDMVDRKHIIRVRFSNIFEHRSQQWLIIHSHYSTPDSMLEEGSTLMEALQARNTQLEKEVAQRTAALNQSLEDLKTAQAQLIHQEKMASLGALTAGIAHEIKNPLNFITNFASLSVDLAEELEKDLANGEDVSDLLADLKHNASAINNHGQRADTIVRGMMQHASGKAGERETIDVHTLLDEYITLALHGKKAEASGFTCRVDRDFAEHLPAIQAAPGELGRVFLNLLSNAFDAMEGQEDAAIKVSTHLTDGAVHIRFSDNGPGISDQIRDRVFEPFFTTKPTGRGTGLGLSLSYDIVTQGHGGTLRVETSEGKGATFVITLPTP